MCDDKNCKNFKSVGTLNIRVPKSGKKELYFTPNAKHSFSDGDKHYAVFLPTRKCKECKGKATPLCESLQSVSISICCFQDSSVLVEAAMNQTVVEVQVTKQEENSSLTLESITIPAPCTKK